MVSYSDDILGKYSSYLDDESGIAKETTATRIWFPQSHDEIVEVVKKAISEDQSITVSGGGTGISGGRSPQYGWILATDQMLAVSGDHVEFWKDPESEIEYGVEFIHEADTDYIRVPVGMPLRSVQQCTRDKGLFYPPDPTERSSYIGGNVSTNASGARSFKYGPTRKWVAALQVVLASGQSCVLSRSGKTADETGGKLEFDSESDHYSIPLPNLPLPRVTKHVAGPVLTLESQPIDLFIGTNGIFGIVTEVKLRLLPPPSKIISMFAYCNSFPQALDLIQRCQEQRLHNHYPIPMSVEYLDRKAVKLMQEKDSRIEDAHAVVLLEQDLHSEEEEETILIEWQKIFDQLEISDISVALTYQENEHHKSLRHWVPEWLIKTTRDYGFPLFITDTSVPQEKFHDFMIYLEDLSVRFTANDTDLGEFSTSLIGHVGDSHPHLAFIPTTDIQAQLAKQFMDEVIDETVKLGGSIASEHGLGKKIFGDQPAIVKQFGPLGIDKVKLLKNLLDPKYRLCPGNIIPVPH